MPTGSAMAMGERTPIAVIDARLGRMAVGEAITNLMGAPIGAINRIASANWMCACGGRARMPRSSIRSSPWARSLSASGRRHSVGKDSLSMRTRWAGSDGTDYSQHAPLSLIVTAFAPVTDARLTVTPDLKPGASALLLIDLGGGRNRLGGSALAQVFNQTGSECADLDDPERFGRAFAALQVLVANGKLLACHDRSDGGAVVTLAEMAMAGGRGVTVNLPGTAGNPLPPLFSEELGIVLQVRDKDLEEVHVCLEEYGLLDCTRLIGTVRRPRLHRAGRRRRCHQKRHHRPARHLVGAELADAASARQPGLRRHGV